MNKLKTALLSLLLEGDLRSAANHEAINAIIKSKQEFDILFSFLHHIERVVLMHAADAVEKLIQKHPQYLSGHEKEIIELCERAVNKELKWHLAQLVSKANLSSTYVNAVWPVLYSWATDQKESRIVRVFSLQSLFDMASQSKQRKELKGLMDLMKRENVPSINSRIRKLEKQSLKW